MLLVLQAPQLGVINLSDFPCKNCILSEILIKKQVPECFDSYLVQWSVLAAFRVGFTLVFQLKSERQWCSKLHPIFRGQGQITGLIWHGKTLNIFSQQHEAQPQSMKREQSTFVLGDMGAADEHFDGEIMNLGFSLLHTCFDELFLIDIVTLMIPTQTAMNTVSKRSTKRTGC